MARPPAARERRAGARTRGAPRPLLVLLLLACCTPLRPRAASTEIQQPDYSIYLRRQDLLQRVADLAAANPRTMRAESRQASDAGYSIDMLIVTAETAGLSKDSGGHTDKVRLLLDFGEHGREYITSELALRLLRVLANGTALEAAAGGARRAARLRHILDACVFKIIPMENTRGRELVERGQLCERKNGRGVDTNRNWDVDWGKKEKDYDPSEEYPGRAPHSEPEVKIILSEAQSLQPHVWVNVHSGMYALFTPFDHKATVPDGPDAAAAVRMMERINGLSCKGKCAVGSGGKSVGYLAHGTATDYMYTKLRVPLSFTWEIYGDMAASFDDCFRMFNPVTKQAFEETLNDWLSAFLHLLELLPTHPATAPLLRNALAAADAAEAAAAKGEAAPAAAAPAAASLAAGAAGGGGSSGQQQQQRHSRNAEAHLDAPAGGAQQQWARFRPHESSGGGGRSSSGAGPVLLVMAVVALATAGLLLGRRWGEGRRGDGAGGARPWTPGLPRAQG
ncbi:metallocarboxypeptidase A [Raphidocelis subcapitata]|uniref:Metallocarboxypeptidase A n=1 Tax=Raphidocelis subcapitata TaxID=307507 RepID=A0A2V0NVR7_9CHLO|nr:metallocarboxypeptidase A [Raphidocelis subcapitata]|eukprot:GBF89660.1 metallocarboxypeptidase A [Raphidocelis subcapitata]